MPLSGRELGDAINAALLAVPPPTGTTVPELLAFRQAYYRALGIEIVDGCAGDFVVAVNSSLSPYSPLATDQILACDTTGGAVTITLPASGGVYWITLVAGALPVTVTGLGVVSAVGECVTVVYAAGAWRILQRTLAGAAATDADTVDGQHAAAFAAALHGHAEADVVGLVADLAARLLLAGGTMTGILNSSSQLFLTANLANRLGIGFGVGAFSHANAVIEAKVNNRRLSFLNGPGGNVVLSIVNLDAGGKGGALFVDTTGTAFIFDNAGSFDFTSDTKANIVAGTFGTGTSRIRVKGTGEVGIGVASPTARLHLPAGTAVAGTAPEKVNAGVLLAAPEAGAREFDGSYWYGTNSTPARCEFATVENHREQIVTVLAAASPYTALASDVTILCDCTAGAIQVNLPAVAGSAKRVIRVKKIDATVSAVTIQCSGAELCDGANTQTLAAQWATLSLHCDGAAWYLV